MRDGPATVTGSVLVLGTGLIGTSLALALAASDDDVLLADRDAEHLAVAVRRGAGRPWDGCEAVHHVVLATPPRVIAGELRRLQELHVAATYSHVASTQAVLHAELETSHADLTSICGTHPMAGRELSGPGAATAELFVGRPWALCPGPTTSPTALAAARELARRCGADPVVLTAGEHDSAVALVSHLPQVAASAVAAVLLTARATDTGLDPVRLAGPGLQDTTRIAASDPDLWVDVLTQNAAAVAPLVRALAGELLVAADALQGLAAGQGELGAVVADLLRRGGVGRSRVPVKHSAHDRDFSRIGIAVPDRPGQLAGVLVSAAEAGINVEDVRVEHLAGRPRGIIELLVQAAARDDAARALAAAGWDVLV
ncbi:MAG: prephenate dehydrogenase [Frankiales bacterium]|nr:prephenate dehydrogenase [Frankiales bacterium]